MMAGVKSSTEEQIHAVSEYLERLANSRRASAVRAAPDGKAIFSQNCAACHGPNATGGVGPDITQATLEDITAAIEQVPIMVAMKVLGARDVKAAADYLADSRASRPAKVDQ